MRYVSSMRERVQITKQVVETDAIGNHVNTQMPFCSRWAYVNKASGKEAEEAGVTRPEETLNFIIRFDSVTRQITPDGYQVQFRGKTFNITSVDNYRFRNESLTLRCVQER